MISQRLWFDEDHYNPYQNPPDFTRAQIHRKATSVGINQKGNTNCPCCQNPINKQQISLCCKDELLVFMGVGYSIFYKSMMYFISLLSLVFIISGTFQYFFININCELTKCLHFLAVPILHYDVYTGQSNIIGKIPVLITSISILISVIYSKIRLKKVLFELQHDSILPQQYTIMLQNISQETQKKSIFNWIVQNTSYKPLIITQTYNLQQWQQLSNTRQQLTIKRNKLILKKQQRQDQKYNQAYNAIKIQIQQVNQLITIIDQQINKYYQNYKDYCKKLGTVFVTFDNPSIAIDILKLYQSNFISIILQRDKLQKLDDNRIFIFPAPNPRQLIWQNLKFSYYRQILFILIFILSIIGCFILEYLIINYSIKRYRFDYRHILKQDPQKIVVPLASIISGIIIIQNIILRILSKTFSKLCKFNTYTNQETSFIYMYSLSSIFNYCLMVYIIPINQTPKKQQIILYTIYILFIVNAFIQVIYKIINPWGWVRFIKRQYLLGIRKNHNPYTQNYVNQLWEGQSLSLGSYFQNVVTIMFVTAWFGHATSFGILISLIGLICDYWIGKYIFLRLSKRPKNISQGILQPVKRIIKSLPIAYLTGTLVFRYKLTSQQLFYKFLIEQYLYFIFLILMIIGVLFYLLYIRSKIIFSTNDRPFSTAQLLFPQNYQSQNPVNRFSWLINNQSSSQQILTQKQKDKVLITKLIEISKKSSSENSFSYKKLPQLKRRKLIKMISQTSDQINQSDQKQSQREYDNTITKKQKNYI